MRRSTARWSSTIPSGHRPTTSFSTTRWPGRLGVAVPPTVLLPHKQLPNGTTDNRCATSSIPLDWEAVFAAVGEHGFLKPIDGGGWRDVHEVHSREEFFRAYDQSRDLCMVYQKAVEFTEYFRCYVVGQKKVRIMPYDPRRPHAERYLKDARPRTSARAVALQEDGRRRPQALPRAGLRLEHASSSR